MVVVGWQSPWTWLAGDTKCRNEDMYGRAKLIQTGGDDGGIEKCVREDESEFLKNAVMRSTKPYDELPISYSGFKCDVRMRGSFIELLKAIRDSTTILMTTGRREPSLSTSYHLRWGPLGLMCVHII